MEKTYKLIQSLFSKYSKFKIKIENLLFIIESINYRLEKVNLKNQQFRIGIRNFVNEVSPKEYLKQKGIKGLDLDKLNKEFIIEEQGIIPVFQPLLFEFNSFVISILSFIDNIIDLYISINYCNHPDGKHWDIRQFMRGKYIFKKNISFDFSKDKLKPIIDKAYSSWLDNIIKTRDDIIHRIAKRQHFHFKLELRFWSPKLGFPIGRKYELKEFEGYREDLYQLALSTINNVETLTEEIVNQLMNKSKKE